MNDEQLLRYNRHILLPQVDIEGQQAILDAQVMIIGLGGLGSPVALYLAAAGIGAGLEKGRGQLTLVDHDHVELSNLQRQIAHQEGAVGQNKADSAAAQARQLNSETKVVTVKVLASEEWFQSLGKQPDVIIDCTDNAKVRYAINDHCLAHDIPWVSGAAIGLNGQVAVFDPRREDSPCYRCLYSNLTDAQQSCADNGILAPVVGVIGALQATEALRLICGFGSAQHGWLHTWNASDNQWQRWRIAKKIEGCCCSGTD